MSDFFNTTIGDQLTLQRGFDITKKQQISGSVPVVSSGGIASYHNEFKAKGPGVVLGRKGTLGTVFFLESEYWPHDTSLWVKDFKGNNPRFVYYFFKSISSQLKRMDVGAANPALNRNHVHPMEVRWPVRRVQDAIVSTLEKLDTGIVLNRQTNQTLEHIAQALFKSWFVDFEPTRAKIAAKQVGQDPERAAMAAIGGKTVAELDQLDAVQLAQLKTTAALFPDGLVESELGEVPEGWRINTINEVTSTIIDHRGKTPKKLGGDWAEKGYPALSAKNIKSGRITRHETIRFLSEELYSKWMKEELQTGDVLLTSEAPMGEMYFLTESTKYCLSQRLYALRADNKNMTPTFLYLWLQTPVAKADLEGRSTGTTVVGIKQSELRKVNILKPSFDLLTAFEKIVFSSYQKIQAKESESEMLATLRDTLLPKLLSGELSPTSTEAA